MIDGILSRMESATEVATVIDKKGTIFTQKETSLSELKKIVSSFGEVTSVAVEERDTSGGILILILRFENGTIQLNGEYNIRYCLGKCAPTVTLANGEDVHPAMLPSAFFYIRSQKNGICTLKGGGYGHGLGMSQNGANGMAKAGHDYEEILLFYYKGGKICSGEEFDVFDN